MIPKRDSLTLPILKLCNDSGKRIREFETPLVEKFELSKEERNQLKISGGQSLFLNRISWAIFHLRKAGFITSNRGLHQITEDGKKLLAKNPTKIDQKFLKTIPAYQEYQKILKERTLEQDEEDENEGISKIQSPKISSDEFFASINIENITRRKLDILRNPDRIKISRMLEHCQSGEWKLPNFQRYFDWKKTDIRDLLDSIFRGFYIGSLLLWEVDKKHESMLKLIPILGTNVSDNVMPNTIILDGQQRITSLHYAITNTTKTKNIKRPVYFYIDFKRYIEGHDDENIIMLYQKLSLKESIDRLYFPFYYLGKYHEWIEAFEVAVENQKDNKKMRGVRKLIEEKLRYFIDEFDVPYITLSSSVDLPQVTDIFEKINTKGKVLSVFDILIATLSKHDINLRQLWDDVENQYPIFKKYNKNDKLPIYILQSLALSYHNLSLCRRSDLLKIYDTVIKPKKLEFDDVWYEMAGWINQALQKLQQLRGGFGVKDRRMLPYLPTIPILASFLHNIDQRKDKIQCNEKVRIWYWASVFSEQYSQGVDNTLTSDFKEMVGRKDNNKNILGWFDDENKIIESVRKFRKDLDTIDLRDIKVENNATFRGVLSLIAIEGAPDFNTADPFEHSSNNDKHHIFPKKHYKSPYINSILNLTWLSNDTNKHIGAKKPKDYLNEFQTKHNNEKKFKATLEKHFINDDAYNFLLNDDFNGFIDEREKTIKKKIANLLGITDKKIPNTTQLRPNTPFSNESAIINTIQSCKEYIYWIDKYFSRPGFEWLLHALPASNIKLIKILTTKNKTNPEKTLQLRETFKKFRTEIKEKGITCELRIIKNPKTASNIHDRWIITKGSTHNVPSTDVMARGQFSEITRDSKRPDFDDWWLDSLDIIDDWDKI